MNKGFRQSQAFLHTWSGLLLGWVLFLVFVTGTIAFWRDGMNRWMRPELAPIEQPMQVLDGAQRFLSSKAPDAKSWFITMPSASTAGAQLFWVPQPKAGEKGRGRRGRRDNQALIGADGEPTTVRATRGGEFFYRFHFDLHYMPVIWARWIVGVAAMMMLVAILSGIVTHKKIFKDFFTLRRRKGQRSWLDGHNAVAVLGLPFHLMITYTGLVTLMALLMPWAVVANYADGDALPRQLFPYPQAVERTGIPAPLVPLTAIVRDAETRLGGPVGFIEVREAGDAASQVVVSRSPASMLSSRTPSLAYAGTTGKLVWTSPVPGGATTTAGAMIGLHAGRFADTVVRWIYFLCGVAGTLMVATGLVLWTVKRREKLPDPNRPHFGFILVERLNVAVLAGFPLGVAAMFWANRLLPVAMRGRAEWEIHVLFLAWAAAAVLSFVRRPAHAWVMILGSTGVLLAILPFYNMAGTPRGIVTALVTGDLLMAGVDLTMLVFGIAFLWAAARVARYRPKVRERSKRAYAELPNPVLEPAE
ncbi:PepSY-associated TM helix domain-containing protein [Sphingomonas xinjiangensis]|uniref:Putative iron-regulated membrane protein n=1 Tax=Sphingomonas xinjiangensis TaxID=643568 RepID=A0A840Y848_9SPHN|nr:PepSY-associated TM helix domain-containing protein [Sphingomonas xinjiangensis]MBB5709477.1 putative iron-regulated membrane protein [Sphingomonas xinjiangensis]